MENSSDRFNIKRVGPHSTEAEYFQSQLHDLVQPFTHDMKKVRRRFPLPDDAIVLVAEDISNPDANGKPKQVGSVCIKRLIPGQEQAEGLPADINCGEIKRMVIVKEYQGTGVAVRLLQAAEDAGKAEFDLLLILVETLHTLIPAQKFYKKSGYQGRAVFGVYDQEDSACFEKFV